MITPNFSFQFKKIGVSLSLEKVDFKMAFFIHVVAPLISIGICATNDICTLPPLLARINSFSGFYEVIIVTSGVSDEMIGVVDEFMEKCWHRVIHIVEKKRRGKWYALNMIFGVFSGDYLILLPADVWINEDSILQLVHRLQDMPDLGVVSGFPLAHPRSLGAMGLLWRLHGAALRVNGNFNSHATGELLAMKRALAHPLPPKTINDDAFLARRAILRGWRVGVVPSAKVIIRVPNSIRGYIWQRERILLGHRQLRSMGDKSTTLKGMISVSPRKASRLILSELHSIKDLLNLAMLVFLELFLMVLILRRRTTEYSIWRRIE
ncbi:MAG: glycosyltransferase [Methanobacteriota archaeon]|nr:MAG: glycosyltransferase [Euryarchaeota archaeon]